MRKMEKEEREETMKGDLDTARGRGEEEIKDKENRKGREQKAISEDLNS